VKPDGALFLAARARHPAAPARDASPAPLLSPVRPLTRRWCRAARRR
jgi:hypothetical protein